MNRDENIIFSHLKKHYGLDVVFEPEPNSTPDFLINSTIAVEARRLNQYIFSDEATEALEKFSFGLHCAFLEILSSFGMGSDSKNSYYVAYEFKRSPGYMIKDARKDIKEGLEIFLSMDVTAFPHVQKNNNKSPITLVIYPALRGGSNLFSYNSSMDVDAGGGVIATYVQNIQYCIDKKSENVLPKYHRYNHWWFYMVDHMYYGINDMDEIKTKLSSIGLFEKIVILSFDGSEELLSIFH